MKRQLPSLSAFKTFEAAARHRSFSRAAEELNVTPAAVSYLVRDLEAQLHLPLFNRQGRSVSLTAQGEVLRDSVTQALDNIQRTIERLREDDNRMRINVTASPSFAMKWLVPRLNRFLTRCPEVDVRVDMSRHVVDLNRGEMDLAIRFGNGDYPGLQAERLVHDELFPVCSPALLKGPRALRRPQDLARVTLIHPDFHMIGESWPTWRMWFDLAGIKDIDAKRGLHFNQSVLAIQGAIDGQGVALADSSLVEFDLAAGRLVRPFEIAVPTPEKYGYWIITSPRALQRPMLAAFRDWLLEEAAASPSSWREKVKSTPRLKTRQKQSAS